MSKNRSGRRSLFSPVFGKEMISLSRRKRYFFARALFLGVLLLTIWSGWRSAMMRSIYSGYADMSYAGNKLFELFTITQLLTVAVLVPAMTAPIIASEKDGDTLGLLMISNLKRGNILLDKLMSRMILIILMLASTLPLFLGLLSFGGIQLSDVLSAYAAMLSTILFCGAFGLFYSTIMRKLASALIATYTTLLLYFFLFIFIVDNSFWYSISEPMFMMPIAPAFEEGRALQCIGFSSFIFITMFFICRALLPRMLAQRKRHVMKRLFDRMNAFFKRINFTGVVLMKDSTPIGKDAILWKETHKSFFCSNIFILRASYTLMIINLITVSFWLIMDEVVIFVLLSQLAILATIALVASATAFSSEREKHSLEVLLSTPLTQWSIVRAKFLGVLKMTSPILINIGICLLIINIVGLFLNSYFDVFIATFHIVLMILAQLPLIIVFGLIASLKRHRTAGALLQAFASVALWCASPLILLAPDLFFDMALFSGYNNDMDEFILSLSPISAIAMIMDEEYCMVAPLLVTILWIGILVFLSCRFDKALGRLRSTS